MDVQALTQQYALYAATETDKRGQTRSPSTLTSYRRALEGFAAAVANSGLTLETLPEDFLEKHWMATQQSVLHQPIQLRVRIGALKQFKQWLWNQNVPCAPLTFPEVMTPPPKPKQPKETLVTYPPDDAMQADPVPSAQTYVPPPAPQVVATVVPPPAPKQVPGKPMPGKNPLAAMLPSSQYKLRVRREREMDDPVWVGDFPADRVAAAGAVEPFLGREVAPRLVAQGITGDVTFLVSSVGPNGQESERNRLTVSCAPQVMAPVQSVAAPVAGVATMPMPAGNPSSQELADLLSNYRRAQEELEERIAKKMEAQQAPKPAPVEERKPVANEELNDLKDMVASLANSVRDLSTRLDEREYARVERMDAAPAPAPQPPQLDILGVIREVTAMTKAQQAPVQQPSQALDMLGMFKVMAEAKQIFQPQQVNIDVSPLEERMEHLQQQLASQAKKKDEISETVEKFKALKELFGVVGGETSASKPTNSLGSALGNLLDKVVNNPAPLAEAVERILGATAQMAAARNGVAPPPRAQPPQPQIPPQVLQATKALLDADGAEATVVAAHEWLGLLTQVPALAKPAERITAMLREGKKTELTIFLRQVFTHLGFGAHADAAKVTQMVKDILTQVAQARAEAEGDDEEAEEEADSPPDLTVRVGGVQTMEQADDEEEEADEEADEAGDEEEADEEAPPTDPREYRRWLAERESLAADADAAEGMAEGAEAEAAGAEEAEAAGPADEESVEATIQEVREVLLKTPQDGSKPTRRKRRTKAEMAAARAAEAEAPVLDTEVAVG